MEKEKTKERMRVRKKFFSYKEAKDLYNLCEDKLYEHAKKAGAFYKLDGKVLINCEIFDLYLEQFREPGEFEEIVSKVVPDLSQMCDVR